MKANITTSLDLFSEGFRLDASYHSNSGLRATKQLVQSGRRLERLDHVCMPDGIFIPPRFKRIFVNDSNQGVPYVTGSSIVKNEPLQGAKLLSYQSTTNVNRLILVENMILITCSGEIGNTVYVNQNLQGSVGSPDLIRVLANPEIICPGYLYAYLSSMQARALIQQKTYGAVIPHIEAHHIIDLPIPRLDSDLEEKIHQLIEESSNHWNQSILAIQKARSYFDYLQTSDLLKYQPHDHDISTISFSKLDDRLGAHYHSQVYRELENYILSNKHVLLRNACDKIFAPPPFKHIYLQKPNNFPFLTGGELRNRQFSDIRFLSPLGMKNIHEYVVRKNYLALYKSGSLDSIFASVFFISDDLDGFCLSDHVIRLIISDSDLTPEYVFAFLSTWAGRLLIVRRATGMAVPFVREESVSTIPIPVLEKNSIQEITSLIRDSLIYRARSLHLERQAQTLLTKSLSM